MADLDGASTDQRSSAGILLLLFLFRLCRVKASLNEFRIHCFYTSVFVLILTALICLSLTSSPYLVLYLSYHQPVQTVVIRSRITRSLMETCWLALKFVVLPFSIYRLEEHERQKSELKSCKCVREIQVHPETQQVQRKNIYIKWCIAAYALNLDICINM